MMKKAKILKVKLLSTIKPQTSGIKVRKKAIHIFTEYVVSHRRYNFQMQI